MAYRALYRTYRPQTFSGVIGQEHVTTVLRHQVAEGKVAHAYLLCGSRGTGKTTSARILARAVNCLDAQDGEPCGRCEACLAAKRENNPDIFEIDAASNNGVDDVRALIEQVQYAPMSLKTRVFIVDEVHMLSGSAFNALLKTLEEPPAHVLFILATTEPQKLPATIISRCQRFDFHRLSVKDIVSTVRGVLEQVGASIDEEGLLLIARAADGGMRDALSLTDQCLAFCGDHVAAGDVYDVLGSMEQGFLFDMASALLASDGDKALRMLDGIVRGGRDLTVFTGDLAGHFRCLLMAKTCGECMELMDCTHDAMQRYLQQCAGASAERLLKALELLLAAQGDMRYLAMPRAMLESVLIRICRPEEEVSLASLTDRVDRLEQGGVRLIDNAAVEALAQRAAGKLFASGPALAGGGASQAPQAVTQGSPCRENPPEPRQSPPDDREAWLPDAPPFQEDGEEAYAPAASAGTAAQTAPLEQAAPGTSPRAADPAGDGEALWSRVLKEMAAQNPLVNAIARQGVAQSLKDGVLTVGFSPAHAVYYDGCSAPINFNKLQAILEALAPGTRLTLTRLQAVSANPESVERAKALFGDKLTIK